MTPSIGISSICPMLRTNIVLLIVALVLGAMLFLHYRFSTPFVLPIGFGGLL